MLNVLITVLIVFGVMLTILIITVVLIVKINNIRKAQEAKFYLSDRHYQDYKTNKSKWI